MSEFLGEFSELWLTECGRERCSPIKNIISDVKHWHTLHYVLYGKGTFILGDTTYNLEKGDIFYIPPGLSSQYFPDKQEPWMYVWMGFDGTQAEGFISRLGLSEKSPIFKDDKKFTLKPHFNELADRYNDSAGLNLNCMSAALKVFYEMLNLESSEQIHDQKASHVHEAKQFVANNYQFPITVRDIADSLGLTPNYLANIFKQVLKTSPKQFLISYRMNKACYLLLDGELSVGEISKRVGYDNQLHFSAEFKRIKGCSPSEFRKKNKL